MITAPHYRVLYDIGAEHFHWTISAMFLAFAIVCALGFPISLLFSSADRGRAFAGSVFSIVFGAIVGLYSVHQFGAFQALQKRLAANEVMTTDGLLAAYRRDASGRHGSDYLQIGDRTIEVLPGMLTPAFSGDPFDFNRSVSQCLRVKTVGKDIVWIGLDESGASCR